MKTLSKKAKCWIISVGSILLATVLVLTGVGIGLMIGRKTDKTKGVIDPLAFSIDAWDGSTVNANNFKGDFGGRGDNTYTIDSAASFVHFINQVNSGKESFEGKVVYLNKNIDLNGKTINSIGSAENKFKGTFDGGYYTIFNANIKGNGLFGNIENAEIKNLGVYNCKVQGSNGDDFSAGLVGKAKNSNIFNSFVRLGEIGGDNVAGLVGEFEATNGTYQITKSFTDLDFKGINNVGLVGTFKVSEVSSNSSDVGSALMINCYSTIERMYYEINNEFGLKMTNVIKPNSVAAFFDVMGYNSNYAAGADWCDYKHLENTKQLSFNFPIQSGFGKTLITGSYYESVVKTNNGILDASNLAKAFIEADNSIQIGSGGREEVEINLLVEKIFMESEAIVANNVNVVVNPIKNTEIIRGENNQNSMFVSSGGSKVVLGSENKVRATQTTITLDGNREFIEENDLNSGALVVSYGGEVEIHKNVKLQNNVNTTTGHGGAVLVYGGDVEAINISADIENCSAEFAGGGICLIGVDANISGEINNCSTEGNGGAVAILEDGEDTEAVRAMARLYGGGKTIKPLAANVSGNATISSGANGNFSGSRGGDAHGGAYYCNIASYKITLQNTNSPTPMFMGNHATVSGGAIYTYGSLEILSEFNFEGNYATVSGGALCVDKQLIWKDYGKSSFYGNYLENDSLNDCYGGAVCAGGGATISEGCEVSFDENYIFTYANGYGGAMYVSTLTHKGVNLECNGNYVLAKNGYGGAIFGGSAMVMDRYSYSSFVSNFVDAEGGNSYGGAIFAKTSLTIQKAEFKGNQARSAPGDTSAICSSFGGAIAVYYISGTNYGALALNGYGSEAIKFDNNMSYSENGNADGGAIAYSGKASVEWNIINTTLHNNRAISKASNKDARGGAIFATNASILKLNNNVEFKWNFAGNNSSTTRSQGGAIFLYYSGQIYTKLLISDQVEFTGNGYYDNGHEKFETYRGGAIYSSSSSNVENVVTIDAENDNSLIVFKSNRASYQGGAIMAPTLIKNGKVSFGDITEDGVVGSGNKAREGGAIFAAGKLSIEAENVGFYGNSATRGGAIYNNLATEWNWSNITFVGNTAKSDTGTATQGGALYSAKDLDLTIGDNSVFNYNEAEGTGTTQGGAICLSTSGSTLKISGENVEFIGNKAVGSGTNVAGGAIYASNLVDITNDAEEIYFANNESNLGGAIYANNLEIFMVEATVYFGVDKDLNSAGNKAQYGGAIYCVSALNASIDGYSAGIYIKNNVATQSGGAIHLKSGGGYLYGCIFENNSSTQDGGAIFNESTENISLNNCMFVSNFVNDTTGTGTGYGGAIVSYGPCAISNTVLSNNRVVTTGGEAYGGAVYGGSNCNLIISETSFNDNYSICNADGVGNTSALAAGGAVYLYGTSNTFTIEDNSSFSNNWTTGKGGAIYTNASTEITDGGFYDNGYDENFIIGDNGVLCCHGGAIALANGVTLTLNGSTKLIGNRSYHAGGSIFTGDNVNISLNNNIQFKNNTSKGNGGAIYTTSSSVVTFDNFNSGDFVLFEGNKSGGYGGAVIFNNSATIKNARFVGNSTQKDNVDDHSYTFGGAIYAASNLTIGNNVNFENNYSHGQGGAIDVVAGLIFDNTDIVVFSGNSAYSYGGAIYTGTNTSSVDVLVKNAKFENNYTTYTTNDSANDKYSGGGAIYMSTANLEIGDGVSFYSNTTHGFGGAIRVNSSSKELKITGSNIQFQANGGNIVKNENGNYVSLTFMASRGGAIYAPGAVTISDNANFHNNSAKNGGAIFANKALTISNGAMFQNNNASQSGGAIYYANSAALSLTNIKFYNNIGGDGAAIYSETASEIAINSGCVFTGNQAQTNGGAIYYSNESGSLNVNNTTDFKQNKALERSGGAIYSASQVTIGDSCSFIGNNASTAGGAIYMLNGQLTVGSNNTFDNNDANDGGALYASQNAKISVGASNTFTNNDAVMDGGAIYSSRSLTLGVSNYFEKNTAGDDGGAIYYSKQYYSTPYAFVITNGTFKENTAGDNGGAIYFSDSVMNLYLKGGSFINNTATNGNGGAIASSYSVNIDVATLDNGGQSETLFEGNESLKGQGGAICTSSGSVFISKGETGTHPTLGQVYTSNNVTFTANKANTGGAIFCYGLRMYADNVAFSLNEATYQGGAVFVDSDTGLTSTSNVTFDQNKAEKEGGAVFVRYVSSCVKFTDGKIVFSGNESLHQKGGAIATHGTVTISGSSDQIAEFTNNKSASQGGAIFIFRSTEVAYNPGSTFNYVKFENNSSITTTGHASYGGAVANTTADTCAFTNVEFINNSVTTSYESATNAFGGAIYSSGSVEISSSTFDGNKAISQASAGGQTAAGGAVYSTKNIQLESGNTFKNNEVRSWRSKEPVKGAVKGAAIYSVQTVIFNSSSNIFENHVSKTTLNKLIEGGAVVHADGCVKLTYAPTFNEDLNSINDISIAENGYIEINSTANNKEYSVYKFNIECYIVADDNPGGKIFKTETEIDGIDKSIDLVNLGTSLAVNYNDVLENWGVVVSTIVKPSEDKSWVTKIYNGSEHVINDRTNYGYDPDTMILTGNKATNVGTYQVQVTPKPGHYWEDGTTESLTILNWRIVYPSIDVYDQNGNYIQTVYAVNKTNTLSSEFDKNISATLTTPTSTASSVFGGWSTEQTGGKKVINSDGSLIKSIPGITNSESQWNLTEAGLKLYQQFGTPTVKVTFDGNGGYYYDDPSKTSTYRYMPVGGSYYYNENIYPQFGSEMTVDALAQLNADVEAGNISKLERTTQLETWNTAFDLNENTTIKYSEENGYYFSAHVGWVGKPAYADFKTYSNGSIVPNSNYTYVIEIINFIVGEDDCGTKIYLSLGDTNSSQRAQLSKQNKVEINKAGIYVFNVTGTDIINAERMGRDYLTWDREALCDENYVPIEGMITNVTVDFKVSLFRGTMEEEGSEQYFKDLYESKGKKAYWYDSVGVNFPKPYKEHYTYQDYLIGGRPVELYDTVPAGGVTLTADYTANSYKIDYYDENELIAQIPYTFEDEIELYVPEKEGWEFVEWRPAETIYNSDSTQVSWDATQTYKGTVGPGKFGNVTLVAEWKVKRNSITVTFELDGKPIDDVSKWDAHGYIQIDGIGYEFTTTTTFNFIEYGTEYQLHPMQNHGDLEVSCDDRVHTMQGEDVTLVYIISTPKYFATVKWDSMEHLKETPNDEMLISVEWAIEEMAQGGEQGDFGGFDLNYSEQGQTGTVRHCDIMYISVSSFGSNWGFACAIDLIVDGNVVATTEGNSTFAWIPSEYGMGKNIVIDIVVKQIVEIDIYYQPSIDLVSIGEALGDSVSDYPNMITFSVYYNINATLIATMRNSDYEFIGWYYDDLYESLYSDENPCELYIDGSINELYLRILSVEVETAISWEDFIGINMPDYIELSVTGNYDDDEKLVPTLSDVQIAHQEGVVLKARKGVVVTLTVTINSDYYYNIDTTKSYDGILNFDNTNSWSWAIEQSELIGIIIEQFFHIDVYRNDHAGWQDNIDIEPDDCDTFERLRLSVGASVTFTSTGVDDGYKFEGWYYDAEFKELASSDIEFIDGGVETSYSLYQKIVLEEYTITFDENGGEELEDMTYTLNQTITLPTPTKAGHTFTGWKLETAIDGWEAGVYEAETEIESGKFGDITLVAQWEINTYTADVLFFNVDNWTNPTNLNIQTIGGTTSEEILKPMFSLNWTATYSTSPITITATPVETEYSYSIQFTNDSGKHWIETTSFDWIPISNVSIIVTVFQIYNVDVVGFDGLTVYNTNNETEFSQGSIKHGSSLELQVVANNAGYHFDGWYQDNTYSTLISDLNPYEITVTSDVTLYPHIAPNDDTPYVVNHHYENLDGSYLTETENLTGRTDSEVTPEIKPRDGFIYHEPQTVTIKGDGSTVVNYYYERAQFTLTLNGDDGIESVSGAGTYYFEEEVEISAVALEGYAFIKWTGILESTDNPATIKMPAGDITLTATTEVVACTITIIVNNADYGSVDPTSVNANYFASIVESGNTLTIGDKIVTATPNASNEVYDYEFDSWSGLKEEVDGDMTITANFKQIAKAFTISYDLDGGTAENPETYTADTETFTLNNPTLEGYEFAGWIGTDLTELTQEVVITKGANGNREYTAKWYAVVTIESENSNGTTAQVAVYKAGSLVGTYSDTFKAIKGETYSFNAKSIDYKGTQILRIYVDNALVKTTNSTVSANEIPFAENRKVEKHETIKFEYLSAYIMTVHTPVNTIEGITVETVNNENNIVLSTSAGYMIATGSEVRFKVDSTPAESAEYLYSFIGFNYVVDGEVRVLGATGGVDFENIEFVQNTDYQDDSGVGTYTYLIPGNVQITEITVLAVVNKDIQLNVNNIVSGTITICSQYGFNKVIDKQTEKVVLYSGRWTVISMPEGYDINNLEEIFPDDCVITQTGDVITIDIP